MKERRVISLQTVAAPQSVEDLILSNQKFVWHLVNQNKGFASMYGIELEDLASVGNIGLIKAAKAYDPNQNTLFPTFAGRCITNEIWRYLKRCRKRVMTVPVDAYVKGSDGLTFCDLLYRDPDFSLIHNENFSKNLTTIEKSLIRLRLQGFTQAEIAAQLGVTQSWTGRLLKKLRLKLEA